MEYSLYLFSKLFDSYFKFEYEYDIMFEDILYLYDKYQKSEYNNSNKGEYECIVEYLENNRVSILVYITQKRLDSFPPVVVKFGDVVFEFHPSEEDEWQSDGEYDYHYCLEYNELCVYKVVDGKVDISSSVHSQKIFS